MDDGNPEIQVQQNEDIVVNALYNDIRGGWQGPGNIEVDPLFEVDSFMLAAESKCIGRGTDSIRVDNSWVYAPILDIYGMERPRASTDRRIDLGAVESPYDYPLQYQSESMINVPGEKPTIQSGIDAASEGDTVLVANGIYYENIDFKGKAITVASEFLLDGDPSHISRTMIDGSQFTDPLKASTVTILDVLDNEFLLAGFTIMGGEGSAFMLEDGIGSFGGGGILMISSSGTIRNNIIEKNIIESAEGRGFSAVAIGPGNSDTVYVYDNVIRENELHTESIGIGTVGLGAGGKKVTIHFHNNIVTRNIITTTAPYNIHGAGLLIQTEYSYGADIRVYNNRIDHNELHCQSSVGSGIYVVFWNTAITPVTPTQVRIYNNVIAHNYSEHRGGGIAVWNVSKYNHPGINYPPDPVISNNTLIGNMASEGSGIFNYDANTVLFNNILWDSIPDEHGSEIFQDSIVEYNFCPDPCWPIENNEGILSLYNNCIKGGWENGMEEVWEGTWEGEGNVDSNPLLLAETYELSESSPCIGTGIDSVEIDGIWFSAPALDMMGSVRPDPVDQYADIGALESQFAWKDPTVSDKTRESQLELLIYPNPTKDQINLRLNMTGTYELKIISLLGSVVHSELCSGCNQQIDLSDLPDGIFLIRIQSEEMTATRKIVKR
jgi:hypothetical protein